MTQAQFFLYSPCVSCDDTKYEMNIRNLCGAIAAAYSFMKNM